MEYSREGINVPALPIVEMMRIFGKDRKRIDHAVKVFGYATAIAEMESMDQGASEIIAISAILHDIGIKECERKYNNSSWECQEIEGPPMATDILRKSGVSEDIIDRVCFIIGHHHSYEYMDGLDFQVLVEADFIVNACEKDLDENTVKGFMEKYFRTDSGKRIIRQLYEGQN